MPTTLWRSQPKYCGHVADGWFQTADGRLQYRPPADPVELRRRLVELIGEPATPFVRAVAIGSALPRQEQIEHVIAELAKAPQDELQEWQELGGVVDVIPGANASRHPKTGISLITVHCGGWYSVRQKRIVVAADSPIQPPVVVLHELGHAVDSIHGLSRGSYWQRVIGGIDREVAPFLGEQFAESFGRYYHGLDTRAMLSREVQEFFRRTFT